MTVQMRESELRLAIIENPKLASQTVAPTLSAALHSRLAEFVEAEYAWDTVQSSLNAVSRDIATRKIGALLHRLLVLVPRLG